MNYRGGVKEIGGEEGMGVGGGGWGREGRVAERKRPTLPDLHPSHCRGVLLPLASFNFDLNPQL